MGKHKKEDSTSGGDLTLDEKPKLQAVILADSFLESFEPLTSETPKVLCPLNNVTILDYAMDFLAGNGVEEVYVVCTNDALEREVTENQTWRGRMEVNCVKDTSLTNSGDSLRELYKRNVITSDPFLLMFGDVVTNMDLTQAMQLHQQRHQEDSAAIMTLVLNPTGEQASVQSATSDLVVAMDPTSNRVLLYDNHSSKTGVRLPCSFFAAHPSIEVRTDLMDTGVFLCSPDVLGRFEDEFDYLDITQDFVTNSVAEEEEGLQARIHAHVLSPTTIRSPGMAYAARVVDFATYHAVSQDLLQRWCYPVVADNLHSKLHQYKYWNTAKTTHTANAMAISNSGHADSVNSATSQQSPYQYKETMHPSRVSRSSTVQGPATMLGSGGTIDDHAFIKSSVLGNSFHVGAGATIEYSHLWDGVVVEDNATVSYSVLAKNVVVRKGAVISRGCVLGEGCVIDENVVVPEFTRVTLQEVDDDDMFGEDGGDGFDDDWKEVGEEGASEDSEQVGDGEPALVQEFDTNVVGVNGKGNVWRPSTEEDDDSEDEEDDDDMGRDGAARIPLIELQSMGVDLKDHYQQRWRKQAEPTDNGFDGDEDGLGLGDDDDSAERMESEAFAAYTEGAFTFEDTPSDMVTGAPTSGVAVFGRQKGVDVVKELKEICMDFNDNGNTPMENLAIELNSYKFSQNATYSDCTKAAMLALLEKMEITPDTSDGKLVSGFKAKVAIWKPLLEKMSVGQAEEIAIVNGLERASTASPKKGGEMSPMAKKLSSGPSFRFLLQTLHDEEVLSEDAILAWASERKNEPEDSSLGKLFNLPAVQQFLEWLEEDDDDDSEEDSEEDSDDED